MSHYLIWSSLPTSSRSHQAAFFVGKLWPIQTVYAKKNSKTKSPATFSETMIVQKSLEILIFAFFQERDKNGKMNKDSSNTQYTFLIANLRTKEKKLAEKIQNKVYKYEFLK